MARAQETVGLVKWTRALPLILGFVCLIVYWRTCAPDITWAHQGTDGGDLLAAVRVLGIPHPPGYPSYVLTARLFSLLPIGEFAFRLNLFSAFCAACATVCLSLWLYATLPSRSAQALRWIVWSAAAASLLLAFSPLFWSQALITEVYALNALCVALCLRLLARWQETHRRSDLVLLALVFGLGLGNHPTLLLLLPVLFWPANAAALRGRVGLAIAIPTFLIGLSIYLYLPLRALARPLINWGDARTWEQFWWMVTGKLYHPYMLAVSWAEWPMRLAEWAALSARQFGLAGWGLALIGLAALWRDSQRLGASTMGAFLLYSFYAIGYNTPDWEVYLVPAYVLAALWIARGLLCLFERAAQGHSQALSGALILSCLLLPLASLLSHWASLDLSRDHEARDYAASTLELLPKQAIIVAGADRHTFALWYMQIVNGRQDVLVLDRALLHYSWYRKNLAAHYPHIFWPEELEDASMLARFLAMNMRYPIFLADADDSLMAQHIWQAQGPLYRLVSP